MERSRLCRRMPAIRGGALLPGRAFGTRIRGLSPRSRPSFPPSTTASGEFERRGRLKLTRCSREIARLENEAGGQAPALLQTGGARSEVGEEELIGAVGKVCRTMQRASRLKRELQSLSTEPPPGITCWQHDNRMDDLRAQILGGADTPYEKGIFSLEVILPERYPFEPPKIRFLTPIYHPNIDSAGRICLDILKLPPKGAWRPSLNISTVLTSIQLLMAEPNPDDPLMADISLLFKYNKQTFLKNARKWTEKHAVQKDENSESDRTEGSQPDSTSTDLTSVQKRKQGDSSGKAKKPCFEP
ncbi:ubiquitin-conjugating enzyme E2 T isoform X2 [Rhinatrema bivittatum]|uniref:ubiquitin-conjugating enzyme E2 T isoform X2 n=1 Tax=Rhinatrema bivittatum TaxID=194408 RepID=UPI00112BF984|nr:ubiquitin-conjugating enzyme E2 T isoform X2 [Rhinatrema bivittatum]